MLTVFTIVCLMLMDNKKHPDSSKHDTVIGALKFPSLPGSDNSTSLLQRLLGNGCNVCLFFIFRLVL